jgi:plasmid stabilization system protein ParE
MKLVIRDAAAADLEHIYASIARYSPRVADTTVERLLARMRGLLVPGTTRIGRPGRLSGTRELVERPYIIVYEVDDDMEEIVVLGVVHGRRNR